MKRLATDPCRVEGCLRALGARCKRGKKGQIFYDYLCVTHRGRWNRHRDFDRSPPRSRRGMLIKTDAQLGARYRYTEVDGQKYLTSRLVWSTANGPIPTGYVIHHIDHNSLNNTLENLVAMCPSEHRRLHDQEKKQCLISLIV